MGKFSEYIGSQFRDPRGIVGIICCKIMNVINRAMYKRVVALIDIPDGAKILDIGYGNGCLCQGMYLCNVVYTKKWLDKLSYTEKGFHF